LISEEELFDFHLSKIQLLDDSPADLLACETIPSFPEAIVLSKILKNIKKKAWVTFSCKDESHINDGTTITDCVELFNNHPSVFALGVNCTKPQYITGLIRNIKSVLKDKKIVVYPNSGEEYQADNKTWSSPADLTFNIQLAKEWLEEGADIIGGCCRVGPDQIKEMAKVILN